MTWQSENGVCKAKVAVSYQGVVFAGRSLQLIEQHTDQADLVGVLFGTGWLVTLTLAHEASFGEQRTLMRLVTHLNDLRSSIESTPIEAGTG